MELKHDIEEEKKEAMSAINSTKVELKLTVLYTNGFPDLTINSTKVELKQDYNMIAFDLRVAINSTKVELKHSSF